MVNIVPVASQIWKCPLLVQCRWHNIKQTEQTINMVVGC